LDAATSKALADLLADLPAPKVTKALLQVFESFSQVLLVALPQ